MSRRASFDARGRRLRRPLSLALIPAAAAASIPFRPSVLGTTTLFTFLIIFPLASTRQSSGTQPKTARALAAQ